MAGSPPLHDAGNDPIRPIREQRVELGEVSMGTDFDTLGVVIMLAALLTMLAALVWWDGWPVEDTPVEHAPIDADGRPRR
jgi:hypothetical protein